MFILDGGNMRTEEKVYLSCMRSNESVVRPLKRVFRLNNIMCDFFFVFPQLKIFVFFPQLGSLNERCRRIILWQRKSGESFFILRLFVEARFSRRTLKCGNEHISGRTTFDLGSYFTLFHPVCFRAHISIRKLDLYCSS